MATSRKATPSPEQAGLRLWYRDLKGINKQDSADIEKLKLQLEIEKLKLEQQKLSSAVVDPPLQGLQIKSREG
jgi:hypothetical protein